MQAEVRVYLLDGSSSMLGPRARMRDAILVAELATVLSRLESPRKNQRVVLYYQYFNDMLGAVRKVNSTSSAIEAIADVTATPRSGGTDIEKALVSAMELVFEAQQGDLDLSQAQIVLITDGESKIRQQEVAAARGRLGNLPVGISVIALGQENLALRKIVAVQRSQHEHAFYHYVPDSHLERLSDSGPPVHLPTVPRQKDPNKEQELAGLLEQLADLQRSRESASLRDLDRLDRDNRITPKQIESAGEGARARLEALYQDDLALLRRYQRWFPEIEEGQESSLLPAENTSESDDLNSLLVVLATITEVVESVGSTRLGRRADAVDLLERVLPNARLTPARYHELLRLYPTAASTSLAELHSAVDSGLGRHTIR